MGQGRLVIKLLEPNGKWAEVSAKCVTRLMQSKQRQSNSMVAQSQQTANAIRRQQTNAQQSCQ